MTLLLEARDQERQSAANQLRDMAHEVENVKLEKDAQMRALQKEKDKEKATLTSQLRLVVVLQFIFLLLGGMVLIPVVGCAVAVLFLPPPPLLLWLRQYIHNAPTGLWISVFIAW